MSIFANKTLMITGGTGSFGNAVLNRFLDTDIKEIRVPCTWTGGYARKWDLYLPLSMLSGNI